MSPPIEAFNLVVPSELIGDCQHAPSEHLSDTWHTMSLGIFRVLLVRV